MAFGTKIVPEGTQKRGRMSVNEAAIYVNNNSYSVMLSAELSESILNDGYTHFEAEMNPYEHCVYLTPRKSEPGFPIRHDFKKNQRGNVRVYSKDLVRIIDGHLGLGLSLDEDVRERLQLDIVGTDQCPLAFKLTRKGKNQNISSV